MLYFRVLTLLILSSVSLFSIICVYYPSIDAPFYPEDFGALVDNGAIQNIDWSALAQYSPMREVGYFSFAVNYYFSELDLTHLHATSIGLHVLMGFSVYCLSISLLKYTEYEQTKGRFIALIAMVLFLFSPINSQAVIYIAQRSVILSAIFYLLTMIAYLKCRWAVELKYKLLWFVLGVALFTLCSHSSSDAVTLPLAIVVLEVFFVKPKNMEKLPQYAVVLFLCLLSLWLADFLLQANIVKGFGVLIEEAGYVTSWAYCTHQLTAIWIYTIKFFVPSPLLLDYSTVAYSWSDDVTWFSLIGHIVILTLATKMRGRLPVITVLVFCYYIAYLAESSFVTTANLMFEHRSYLPNVFLVAIVSIGLYQLARIWQWLPVVVLVSIASASSYAISERIELWKDPVELYRHELTYTEDNPRSYAGVAVAYAQQGRFGQADKWFKITLQVGKETGKLQVISVLRYLNTLKEKEQLAKISSSGIRALNVLVKPKDKAELLFYLADDKAEAGLCSFANGLRTRAIKLYPEYADKQAKECVSKQ